MSSEGFKKFEVKDRNCHLENEVDIFSVFKVYTKNNCKYECYVENAKDTCKCIPWDFIHYRQQFKIPDTECDVFGRACFFNAMEDLTKSPDDDLCRYVELGTFNILFRQITMFIKVRVAFVFGLQTPKSVETLVKSIN